MSEQNTILIIDDEKTVRDSFAMYLEDYGYLPLTAKNGSEGLAVFEQKQPDLVLVDLRMPKVGGIEVLSRISTELSPETPLIVVSGTGNISDAINALRSGAWDYILKPVEDLSVLTYRIQEALEKARLIQENEAYQESLKQMVAEKTKKLQESEDRFRTIVENIPSGTLIIGSDHSIKDVNTATCNITGYTSEELIGQSCDMICSFASQPGECPLWQKEQSTSWGTYTTLQSKEKGERTIIKNTSRIEFEGEMCVLENFLDLTKQKEMEKQLQRQERLAALGQLASGIAHDFRNLLSTIILYAQLSERESNLPPNVIKNLDTIVKESYKATDMVEQILDFSSTSTIKREPLNLATLTTDILSVLKRLLPENIVLKLEMGPQPYIAKVDSGRMQQALTNLAINARDAMPEGGVLRFKLSTIKTLPHELPPVADMPPGTWIHLMVSDNGVGATDYVVEHMFDPFFTTKETGKGTGLGLAQVFGIVRLHQGFIDVEATLGKGTTFHIYLASYKEYEEIKDEEAREIAGVEEGTGETILLVEDKEKLREASLSLLEHLRYRVLTASNGHEALSVCQSHHVDLVITDLIMPKMGGKELAMALEEKFPHLKVLIITGHALKAEDEKALKQANFTDIIYKPFKLDDFSRAVLKALGRER